MILGVIGNYGHSNLGDEAILQGILEFHGNAYSAINVYTDDIQASQKETYSEKVTIIELRRQHGARFTKILMLPFDLACSLRHSDEILIGGGGLFNDVYRLNIVFYLLIASISRLLCKRLFIEGVSIGPIQSKMNVLLLQLITRLAHRVTVRDRPSQRYLQEKCGLYDVQLANDFALYSSVVEVPKLSGAVGLNLIPFGSSIWFDKNQDIFESYLDYMHQIFLILRDKGYMVYFLPVNTDHDNFAIDQFIEQFGISKEHFVRDKIVTTTDLKRSIAKCEFVVCARLHACVLSQLLGVRYVSLAYQDKVWDFCAQFKENDMYRLPIELTERKLLGVLNGG